MENKTLEQMAEEANALGLSYGEYVRVMTTELQEWKRQKGGK